MGKALLILHLLKGSTFRVGKLFTGSKFWILAIYNDETFFQPVTFRRIDIEEIEDTLKR